MTTTDVDTNYCDNLSINVQTSEFDMSIDSVTPSNSNFESLTLNKSGIKDFADMTTSGTKYFKTTKKKEVYKFETNWPISNVSWSNDQNCHKLALTSYIEQYENFVQIVTLDKDDSDQDIESVCSFEHPYPSTKVSWSPQGSMNSTQLLATSADYLRLWRYSETEENKKQVKLECLLNNNQAPLTSFDWTNDATLIVTSSFDSTCNIWDVNILKVICSINSDSTNQKWPDHVYDIAWSHRTTGRDEIVLCGDDSVRLLDLRDPSNPIILYQMGSQARSNEETALVRVSCSKQDDNLVASFTDNSCALYIIDLRKIDRPLCVLDHPDVVNSVSWSPKSSRGICSAGDDQQALIWQVPDVSDRLNEPLLAYQADGKINSISWSPSNIFIAIGYRNILELLRV